MAQQYDPKQQGNFNPNQGFTPPNNGYNPDGFTPPAPVNPYDPNPQPQVDPNTSYPQQQYSDPNLYPQQTPAYDPNTYQPPVSPDQYAQPNPGYYDPSQYPNNQVQAGFDPNAGYSDPNQPSPYPPQYNDPYASGSAQTPPAYGPVDPYSGQAMQDPYGSNLDNTQPLPNDSFEVKKSGSRAFLIVGVSLIVILLIATFVILFMLNNQNPDQATDEGTSSSQDLNSQSSVSSESSAVSTSSSSTDNSGLTTNEGTPAGEAKVNAGKPITSQWLIQYFSTNGAVDANGNCLQANICGEGADPDKDGLKNSEEFEYDTDPLRADTDNDGISDGNEVFVYFTHPRIKDSNRDGTDDGASIVACDDPISDTAKKVTTQRRSEIAKLLEIWQLTEPSIKTLEDAGATQADLVNGFIEANCTGVSVEL